MPYYRSLLPKKLIAGLVLAVGAVFAQAGCATIPAESVGAKSDDWRSGKCHSYGLYGFDG